MIIIIRALSPNKKRKAKRKEKERPKKKRKKRPKKAQKEKKEKKKNKNLKGGQCYYPFPHLCFKVAPCSSYSESHMLSLSYTSGNFSL